MLCLPEKISLHMICLPGKARKHICLSGKTSQHMICLTENNEPAHDMFTWKNESAHDMFTWKNEPTNDMFSWKKSVAFTSTSLVLSVNTVKVSWNNIEADKGTLHANVIVCKIHRTQLPVNGVNSIDSLDLLTTFGRAIHWKLLLSFHLC